MAKVKLVIYVDEEALNNSLSEAISEEELSSMSLEDKVQQEMGWCNGISVHEAEIIEE